MALVTVAALGLVSAAPLWSRGTYMKLQFAADLSSTLSYDGVVFESASPAAAGAKASASSGADGLLGAYDELRLGQSLAVRYYTGHDAFVFERTYPLPTQGEIGSASTVHVMAAGPSAGDCSAIDVSGFYESVANAGGTLPGALTDINTVTQVGCNVLVGGESVCNTATATIFNASFINGTSSCIAHRHASFNGTHLSWSGNEVWTKRRPSFPHYTLATGSPSDLGCAGFKDDTMLVSAYGPSLAACNNDGPIFAMRNSTLATLAFSTMDHFASQVVNTIGDGFGVNAMGAAVPDGTTMSTVLLARPGVNRAARAWGSLMRQKYNTTRNRAAATTGLSYWDDNAAGYSWWSVDGDLGIWGQPEEIFIKLYESYAKHGIKFQSWELDQNFIGAMHGFGWCWQRMDWNTTLFPSGGNLSSKLGGLPMVYYISTFCRDNEYRDIMGGKYRFINVSAWTGSVLNAVVHPDDAYNMYRDVLTPLRKDQNMQMLFTDFLCWRGPELQHELGSSYYGAAHKWLEGMTVAAQELGLEIQYCMACAHQAMDSLRWPAVTNARANSDGGMAVPDLTYSSLLAGALGLGWSKDNLRTGTCMVKPCHGIYGDPALQTVLAALSLGPVGLADQLTDYPNATNLDVSTNVTLVKSTAAEDGWLLQPSYPLTPIDPQLACQEGLSPSTGNVWATFTDVGEHTWWVVLGFQWDPGTVDGVFTVRPSHLAPMIDATDVATPFTAVPRGAFGGAGDSLGRAGAAFVWWDSEASVAKPFEANTGVGVRLDQHTPHLVGIAPVLSGVALLGEAGKAAAVSTHRFGAVSQTSGGIQVQLRGAAGESVALLYALETSGFKIVTRTVVIGSRGVAVAALPNKMILK